MTAWLQALAVVRARNASREEYEKVYVEALRRLEERATDLQQLKTWVAKAVTAASLDEIVAEIVVEKTP